MEVNRSSVRRSTFWTSVRLSTSICQVFLMMNLVLIVLFVRVGESARVVQECQSINNIFKSKGFTYPWWGPGDIGKQSQLSDGGSNSQLNSNSPVCPLSSQQRNNEKMITCCTHSFDTAIQYREMSSVFTQKWFAPKLLTNAEIFKERKTNFDEKFKAMLNGAHTSFHAMFERTYGMLYIQHAHVFHALFTTLEKYYEDGRDSLESKLNEFFAILTRKMFEVLNAQYEFDETYLHCATIVISEKQGNDLHRQIISSLRRSFVATRALSQGLLTGERIISNLQRMQMNQSECLIPLAHMLHCPVCIEQRAYKPCIQLCTVTTTNCLSSTMSLTKPWLEYITSLENIIDRLLGPYNIEAVVEPIHIKISEIIMNFQENGQDLSQTVFSKCGKPKLRNRAARSISISKREAPVVLEAKSNIGKSGVRSKPKSDNSNSNSQDKSIEKLLREIKNKIKKSKNLFEVLPKQVCNGIAKDYSSQLCWNGTVIIKPEKIKGPEDTDLVEIKSNVGKGASNPVVTEQIAQLQLITEKLRNAFNGLDVQWVTEFDNDDFGSGMGSGSGDGELTDTEDDDDDDPDGQVHKKPSINIPPDFLPNRTPPPIFNPLPESGLDTDTEDSTEDDDTDSLNLKIDSVERFGTGIRNGGNPGSINVKEDKDKSNSGIDFGILNQPEPTLIPQIIKVRTTTLAPPAQPSRATSKPATTTKVTKKVEDINNTVASSNNKLEGTAGKAIAVIKLFTPVFMSMLGKIFPF